MADVIHVSSYEHLRQTRMPRTSREAGCDHLPIMRSAPLRAWGNDVACAVLMACAVALAWAAISILVS